MDADLFSLTDAAIKKAGTSDPEAVAECYGFLVNEMHGRIIGYATRYSYLACIGLNTNLDHVWRPFAAWHELGHVFRGHIDEPSFGQQHCDFKLFTQEVDSHSISRQEKEANLISAEYNMDTGMTLELIGYNNRTMRDYRRLKAYQERLSQSYEELRFSTDSEKPSTMLRYRLKEYQRTLRELEEKKNDLESDMIAMNCLRTFGEIAGELGTSETILRYKLEALRFRGYDIDVQELESYDKVFRDIM